MEKDKAFMLRKSGKSYLEISEELKISKGTLSGWFAKEEWSTRIRNKLTAKSELLSTIRLRELNNVRGVNLDKAYKEARLEAQNEFEVLKYNPLFIAGLMLYWGEGDKVTGHVVKLSNTDVEMTKLFTFFLSKICSIPPHKIRAQVLIYPDLNENMCRKYWSEGSNIPLSNFIKSSTIQGKHKTKRLGNGVCMVYVSSTYFKQKIMEWIKLLPAELMKREYYENI
jgi:hypothetical protein